MKRTLIILIIFLSVILVGGKSVSAVQGLNTPASLDYQLPYPGLLPDSPLYFLKMVRDQVVEFLITDPLKKAQFNLLQSEKRINAGMYLAKKHETDLAQSTVSKGENYFDMSISYLKKARTEGEDTKSLINTMIMSSLKQEQVIHDIAVTLPKKQQEQFFKEEQRMINFRNLLKTL